MGRSGNPPLFRRSGSDLGLGLPPRARALPKAATKPGGKGRRAGKAEQVGNLPKVARAPGQVAAGNIFAGPVEQFEEPRIVRLERPHFLIELVARLLRLEHVGVPNLSRFRQDPSLVSLGNVIRDLRIAASLSQEQLALNAGLDRSYVGRVERGDNNIALLSLKRIAGALGTTAADLLRRAAL